MRIFRPMGTIFSEGRASPTLEEEEPHVVLGAGLAVLAGGTPARRPRHLRLCGHRETEGNYALHLRAVRGPVAEALMGTWAICLRIDKSALYYIFVLNINKNR